MIESNMKYLFIAFIVVFATFVVAVPVNYDITIYGSVNDTIYTELKNEVHDCENGCSFTVPQFTPPEGFNFSHYTISNTSELIKSIHFESTQDITSSKLAENVIIETVELKEELSIEKLVTKNLNLGQNNIVLQVKNIGSKDIENVSVQISGDGVKTISKTAIDLPLGQSDFVTTIVSITNYGSIDIIVKAYAGDELLGQTIESIFVNPTQDIEEKEKTVFVDKVYAQSKIDTLWNNLSVYEKDFFLKTSQEYNVLDVSNSIDEIKDELRNLQSEYSHMTKEQFDDAVIIINMLLGDVKEQLDLASPKKIATTFKENLGLIATTIGVIVSTLTAIGLAKSHVLSKDKQDKKKHPDLLRRELRKRN